jgi:4-carboxymuconolactone decarboxylase
MRRATHGGALCLAILLGVLGLGPQIADAQRPVADTPRFSVLTMEQLDARQKQVAERVMNVSSAGLAGPYAMLLRSPDLLERYLGMTDYLRFNTSLPLHLNEMAILMEARMWDAQYEWWAHYPIALKAGLRQSIADDIRDGRRPTGLAPDEEVVYDVVVELLRDRDLTDETFARAKAILGEQPLIDLVAVTGFYVMVSTVIHAGRIEIPNDDPPPLPILMKK